MITYSKLQDGSWGLRGQGLVAGTTVTVQKRDGSTKTEHVLAVLWTSPDGSVSLASIGNTAKPAVGSARKQGCSRCCRTSTRTAQIWEECDSCGNEPVYR